MKKIIHNSLYFVFVTIVILSCSKQSAKHELKDPSLLSEDSVFVGLVSETHEFLAYLAVNMKANSLDPSSLDKQLSELASRNLSFEKQMQEINSIYKANVSLRLKTHMIEFKKKIDIIESNYGRVESALIKKEVDEVMSKKVPIQKMKNNIQAATGRIASCGWRYYGCSAAATAGVILCHAGCETTALATTAGLGIPACVAACGTLQAWAIVQCSDTYCQQQ